MTNQFFKHSKTIQRIHKGPLGAYVDDYAALLYEQGYGLQGARRRIRLMAVLSRWLERKGLDAKDVNRQRVESYLRYRRRHRRPHCSDSSALRKLLGLLSEKEIFVGVEKPPL